MANISKGERAVLFARGPEGLRRRLKIRADKEGRPMNDLIVEAVERFLGKRGS